MNINFSFNIFENNFQKPAFCPFRCSIICLLILCDTSTSVAERKIVQCFNNFGMVVLNISTHNFQNFSFLMKMPVVATTLNMFPLMFNLSMSTITPFFFSCNSWRYAYHTLRSTALKHNLLFVKLKKIILYQACLTQEHFINCDLLNRCNLKFATVKELYCTSTGSQEQENCIKVKFQKFIQSSFYLKMLPNTDCLLGCLLSSTLIKNSSECTRHWDFEFHILQVMLQRCTRICL